MYHNVEQEIRNIKMECLHIASNFGNESARNLIIDAEQLFLWVCSYVKIEVDPEDN